MVERESEHETKEKAGKVVNQTTQPFNLYNEAAFTKAKTAPMLNIELQIYHQADVNKNLSKSNTLKSCA